VHIQCTFGANNNTSLAYRLH